MNPDNELMQEKQPLIASAGAKEVHELGAVASACVNCFNQ